MNFLEKKMIVNKNIKVIVSDLDGTLLNSNHTISDRTISVFKTSPT
jgi:hydroxymethylpyrimidine pyrophosphatase-like HAD family hydrolase